MLMSIILGIYQSIVDHYKEFVITIAVYQHYSPRLNLQKKRISSVDSLLINLSFNNAYFKKLDEHGLCIWCLWRKRESNKEDVLILSNGVYYQQQSVINNPYLPSRHMTSFQHLQDIYKTSVTCIIVSQMLKRFVSTGFT